MGSSGSGCGRRLSVGEAALDGGHHFAASPVAKGCRPAAPRPWRRVRAPAEAPRAIAGLTATQARAQVCPGSLPFPTKLWVTLVVLPRDPVGLRALNLRSQAGPGHAPGISELGPNTWPQPWAGSRPRHVGPGTEPGPQGTVTIVIFKTHVVTTSC